MDISFIIIGRNEERNISKCINSILNLETRYKFEIIYIDSNSHDSSIKVAKKSNDVRIYKLTSNFYSAALARNVGADKAKGNVLVFLDGDMEIEVNTDLDYAVNYIYSNYKYVLSGKLKENIYNEDGELVKVKEDRYNVIQDVEAMQEPGGYFLISKKFFDMLNGFNSYISCNEEIELFSRIKQNGGIILRTSKITCIHNDFRNGQEVNINFLRFKRKYYLGQWYALIECLKNNCIKEYLSFSMGKWFVKSRIVLITNMFMLIYLLYNLSIINFFILITILFYILYKKDFDIRKVLDYYSYNFLVTISFIFFIEKVKKIEYYIEKSY